MRGNEYKWENQLVHLQGEHSYNYTVVYNFINTKKDIFNVIQYLEVNSTYTKKATTLIQSTSDNTIRVELSQSESTYNIILNFYFFLDRVELNIKLIIKTY